MPLTIIPALSPPQVPTTSVIGVEVAAEQATAARIAGRRRIRAMNNPMPRGEGEQVLGTEHYLLGAPAAPSW